MPKHAFSPDEIGKDKRYYDESDDDKFRKEVLHWLSDNELLEAENAQETKRLTDALLKKLRNIEKARTSPQANLQELATDLYYSARDLFSGRRIKTSGAIITGILIGAGIGAFLGSWLLPVIGTAIGGALGGMIIAGVTAIGIFGFTVLGAGLGSWIGSKISNAFFKDEKKFQISYRQAKKIKKNLGLGWKDAEMINGYLRNRINAVRENNPEYKDFYSLLRKLVIEAPQEKNLSIAVGFFKNELRLLEQQKALHGSTPALQQDLDAVIYILRSFTKNQIKLDVLSRKAKQELRQFCDDYESGAGSIPSASMNSSSTPSGSPTQSPPPIRIRPPRIPIATTPEKVFKQSQTSIQNLESHFDDAKKYETYDLSSITHPEGSLDRVTLIFKNPSTNHQPEVFAENGKDHSLYFSTTQGLEDEDFEFVAERAARISIDVEPNSIIDLTICPSPNQQYVLYRAFMKAKAGASFPEILVDQHVKDRFEKSEAKKKVKLQKS